MRVPRTPRTSRASGCGYVVTLPIARQASLGASGWHKASAGASPRPGAGRAGDCSRQDGRQPSTSFSTTEQSMMVGEEACLWCFPLVDGRESPAGSSRAFQAAQLEQGRGSREQGCSRSFPWRRWRGRLPGGVCPKLSAAEAAGVGTLVTWGSPATRYGDRLASYGCTNSGRCKRT